MVKITPKQAAGYIIQTIYEYRNELVRAKTYREYLPIEGRLLTDYAERLTVLLKTPERDKKIFEKLNVEGVQELLNISSELAQNFHLAIYVSMKGSQVVDGQELFYIRNAQFYVDGRNSGLTVSELYRNLFQIDYYTDTEHVRQLNLLLGFTDSKINYGEYKKKLADRVNEPKFVNIMRNKHLQEREDPVQGAKFLRYFDAEHGTNILYVTNELDRKVEEVRSDLEKLDFEKAVDTLYVLGAGKGNWFPDSLGSQVKTLLQFIWLAGNFTKVNPKEIAERIRHDKDLQGEMANIGLARWIDLLGRMHTEAPENFALQESEIIALIKTIGMWVDKNKPAIDKGFNAVAKPILQIILNGGINMFWKTDNQKQSAKVPEWFTKSFGFIYAGSGEDLFYTHEQSIQSKFGFADYYNEVADYLGMGIDEAVVTYRYRNKEYKIEFWRGTYMHENAYGGEIGIYSRSLAEAIEDPYEQGSERSRFMYFAAVGEEEQLRMRLTVNALVEGREAMFTNDTAFRKEIQNGTHFWNLAIRTTGGVKRKDIWTKSELFVEDNGLCAAMTAALSAHPKLQVMSAGNSITVIFREKKR